MKTIIDIVQLFCLVALLSVCNKIDAQTIISFDNSPDNTMVMKIQNPKLSNKPDKLILIFDSTTLTCEFSENGIIALHTTEYANNGSVVTSCYSWVAPNNSEETDALSDESCQSESSYHEVEKEEPLFLEDWMLHPNEWKGHNNL